MVEFKVKRIDEKSFWVFDNPQKPLKVKLSKEKEWFKPECKCFKFQKVNQCEHVNAVIAAFPKIKIKQPKKKEIEVEEFIGGDISKQIVRLLRGLSY